VELAFRDIRSGQGNSWERVMSRWTAGCRFSFGLTWNSPSGGRQLRAAAAGGCDGGPREARGPGIRRRGESPTRLSAARDVILAAKSSKRSPCWGAIWLGDGTSPSRLAQEFERRFEGARLAGLDAPLSYFARLRAPRPEPALGHGVRRFAGRRFLLRPTLQVTARSHAIRHLAGANPILVPLFGSWWQAEPWAFNSG